MAGTRNTAFKFFFHLFFHCRGASWRGKNLLFKLLLLLFLKHIFSVPYCLRLTFFSLFCRGPAWRAYRIFRFLKKINSSILLCHPQYHPSTHLLHTMLLTFRYQLWFFAREPKRTLISTVPRQAEMRALDNQTRPGSLGKN